MAGGPEAPEPAAAPPVEAGPGGGVVAAERVGVPRSPAEAAPTPEAREPDVPADQRFLEADLAAAAEAQHLLATAQQRFETRFGGGDSTKGLQESRTVSEEIGLKARKGLLTPAEGVDQAALEQQMTGELKFLPEDIKTETAAAGGTAGGTVRTTPAYAMTYDPRGKTLGRLRVRSPENGRIMDRIDPGVRVTIVTSEPVLKFTPKGNSEPILFVKVRYTDKSGQSKEGYSALKYLVSPYDYKKVAAALSPGPAPAPAPAPAPEPSPPLAPQEPAPAPAPPPAPPQAPAEAPPAPAPEPAPAPAPAQSTPETPPPPQVEAGMPVRALLYGKDGEPATYKATIGENVQVQIARYNARGDREVRTHYFRYGHVVSPGKQIPPPENPENNLPPNAKITKRNPDNTIRQIQIGDSELNVYTAEKVPDNKIFYFESADGLEKAQLNPGVKFYQGSMVTDRGPYQYAGRWVYMGGKKGIILSDKQGNPLSAAPREFSPSQLNVNRMPQGNDMQEILKGKIPQLEWRDNQFHRLAKNIPNYNLRANELVYVSTTDPSTPMITLVRSDGSEIPNVPRNYVQDKPEAANSPYIVQYKKDRALTLYQQLTLAGFSTLPKLTRDPEKDVVNIYRLTKPITDETGRTVKVKAGEFVRERARNMGVSTVEDVKGEMHSVPSNQLQRSWNPGQWLKSLTTPDSFEVGQLQYTVDRFASALKQKQNP